MKSLTIFRITISLFVLSIGLASPGIAQNASCYSPGILVAQDTTEISILPYLDIDKVFAAEPLYADGSQKLQLTMKVKTLRPDLTVVSIPLGVWTIIITDSSGSQRYVQMNSLLGSPRFAHGTVSNLLGIPIFNEIGPMQGSYAMNGTITFSLDKSAIGGVQTGAMLSLEGRSYLNTVGIGLVQADIAGGSSYEVQGTGSCFPFQIVNWGMNGDIPVVNDFTRNGTSDYAVWRPSTGTWYTFDALTGQMDTVELGSGQDGDTPVSGNFDNDNIGDQAIYRRSSGTWQIRTSEVGRVAFIQFGAAEDQPLAGDFDGDSIAEIATYRPSSGGWHILNTVTGEVTMFQFGIGEDRPMLGDFDGDRRADVAVFRPSTGIWYILNSSDGSVSIHRFGLGTDTIVPADYDGDEKTDVAIWRPETGDWWVFKSDSRTVEVYNWGLSPDRVQPADFNGNGRADFTVWRPETGTWYTKHN